MISRLVCFSVLLMLLTVPLRSAVAMTRCVNDSGRSIYTNIRCPEGYFEYGEKKVISEDAVDSILPIEITISDTPCDLISAGQTATYEGVTLLVEEIECFDGISFEQAKEGHLFFGLLVTVQNDGAYKLYTGGASGQEFNIVTKEGYEIRSWNISSSGWSENRMVWNSENVDIGATRKGWIVFHFPREYKVGQLILSINKYNTPHNSTGMGELKVML